MARTRKRPQPSTFAPAVNLYGLEALGYTIPLSGDRDEDQILIFPLGPAGGIREQEVYNLGQPYTPMSHAAVVI